MLLAKIYLIKLSSIDNSISSKILRGLEDISININESSDGEFAYLIHIGFWKPENTLFVEHLTKYYGKVLVSASAKYSLPADYKTSRSREFIVQGIPFYVLTSCPDIKILSNDIWLNHLSVHSNHLHRILVDFGITSDQSYIENESYIPGELRGRIALERLKYKNQDDINESSIIFYAADLPNYYASKSILDMQLRPYDVSILASIGIKKIYDLNDHDISEIYSKNTILSTALMNLSKAIYSMVSGYEIKNIQKKDDTQIADSWLQEISPELAKKLNEYGIYDEASYSEQEAVLPLALRKEAGYRRFIYLSGGHLPGNDRFVDFIKFLPNWLLDIEVTKLGLSVRSNNVLASKQITIIRHLTRYSAIDVRKFENLGAKSINEICNSIKRYLINSNYSSSSDEIEGNKKILSSNKNGIQLENYRSAISCTFDLIMGRDQNVLKLRMGYECKQSTLQEIGDLFNLTRERIRQFEARALKKIRHMPVWSLLVPDKINGVLAVREGFLTFSALEIIDPWFSGCSKEPEAFAYILENFISEKKHIYKVNSEYVISNIRESEWLESVKIGQKVLSGATGKGISKSELKSQIRHCLPTVAAGYSDDLFDYITKTATFMKKDGVEYFVSNDIGVDKPIQAILLKSETPLHYSEIHRQVVEAGYDADIRTVHNALGRSAYLYDRGTYGLRSHLQFNDNEIQAIVSEAEDIISVQEDSRQYHSSEILELINSRYPQYSKRITSYKLNIILSYSTNLKYLKRNIWIFPKNENFNTHSRVDIQQAIISVLEQANKPLTTHEIKDILRRNRGLGSFFQMRPDDRVIKVTETHWGLYPRDVPIPQSVVDQIAIFVSNHLKSTQKGIHFSELPDLLEKNCQGYEKTYDNYLIIALLIRNKICVPSLTQYIYLAEWEGPRRLSYADATRKILIDAGSSGVAIEEGRRKLEIILERPISKAKFSETSNAIGAQYDDLQKVWRIDADSEQDDD